MKFCARICLYLCVHTDRYIFACVCVCLCECVLEIVAMTKIIARFVHLSRCTRPIIQKSYIQLHIIIHKTWQFVKGKLTLNGWHCCHSTHKITAIATSFVGGFYSATAVEIATTTVSTTISFFLCHRCRPPPQVRASTWSPIFCHFPRSLYYYNIIIILSLFSWSQTPWGDRTMAD